MLQVVCRKRVASSYSTTHPEGITKDLTERAKSRNFAGIEFPVSLKDINKFEKNNPEIAVNVLGYENQMVFPLRISEMTERTQS